MARGGSRWGAGRPGWHVKAEHCRSIDVRRWQREGILQPGRFGAWAWTDAETGKQVASISYGIEPGAVVLDYSMGGRLMHQRLSILATPCHFGGHRQWFGCPHCVRRVAVLFFLCRRCSRVVYASQSDDALGRMWRMQAKIERRLGEHWQRPKSMHRTTYDRLMAKIMDCEDERYAAPVLAFGRLFPGHTIGDLLRS
jgi:hypothetical protein